MRPTKMPEPATAWFIGAAFLVAEGVEPDADADPELEGFADPELDGFAVEEDLPVAEGEAEPEPEPVTEADPEDDPDGVAEAEATPVTAAKRPAEEWVTQLDDAGTRGVHGRTVEGSSDAGWLQVEVTPLETYVPTGSWRSPSHSVNSLGVYAAGML